MLPFIFQEDTVASGACATGPRRAQPGNVKSAPLGVALVRSGELYGPPGRTEDPMTIEPTDLRTERLLLRPFRLDDVNDVVAYANDQQWSRYLVRIPYPYSRRDGEQFVAQTLLSSWEEHPQWAIVLDESVVGGINLDIVTRDRRANVGYAMARAEWGKGLTTEVARAVVDHGFERLGLETITARADARNTASRRLMEKLGMTREGVLRSRFVERGEGGERVDQVCYSLLREEWERRAG